MTPAPLEPPGDSIEIRGLTRQYGTRLAVDRLDLRVPRGAFLGLLGTNGAGKTTTLRMLSGTLAPTSGDARIEGHSIRTAPLEVKRRIGVVPDELALFDRMTFEEHLTLVGRIHGLDAADTSRRTADLLQLLEIDDARRLLAYQGSTGMRKKLALAMALLPRPAVLFLDEPFESVDAFAGRTIRDLLLALARRGVTIVLTSHILEVVESLVDHVAILAAGRLAFQGTIEDLHAAGRSVEDALRDVAGRPAPALKDLPWLY